MRSADCATERVVTRRMLSRNALDCRVTSGDALAEICNVMMQEMVRLKDSGEVTVFSYIRSKDAKE
ncbi:hypothetical protein NECAME_17026 [Necator americanus]|uniref:Uncharacterized protein n=1 Tax=Necator americanus TaxID=51031 RepID=W2TUH2_NECAM|nr:hypothetical protein NECAME_17026 [Necator americanus]ETN84736.1 hypothetical protein NECAME_17026 [Necator americanus]